MSRKAMKPACSSAVWLMASTQLDVVEAARCAFWSYPPEGS